MTGGGLALEPFERAEKHGVAVGLVGQAEEFERLTAHAGGGPTCFHFLQAHVHFDFTGHAATTVAFGFEGHFRQGQRGHVAGETDAVDEQVSVAQHLRNHCCGTAPEIAATKIYGHPIFCNTD